VHSKKAKEVGGRVVVGLATDVTHVIARSIDANVPVTGGGVPVPLCAWQEVGWHALGVKVVKLDWLKSCVKNQEWTDESKFLLLQSEANVDVVKAKKAAVKQAEETGGAEAALRLVAGTEKEQKRAAILGKIRYSAAKLEATEPGLEREAIAAKHKQLLEDKELIEELLEVERESSEDAASYDGGGGSGGAQESDGGGGMGLTMGIDSGDVDSEFMDLMNGDDSDDSDDSDGSGSGDNVDSDGGGGGSGSSNVSESAASFNRPAKRKRDVDSDDGNEQVGGGLRGLGGGTDAASSSSSDDDDDDDGEDDTFALDLEAALQGGDGDEDEDPFA